MQFKTQRPQSLILQVFQNIHLRLSRIVGSVIPTIVYFNFEPGEITYQDAVVVATGIVILWYAIETRKQREESRISQTLETLSRLVDYLDKLGGPRQKILLREKVSLSDATKLCNSLDNVGHIAYKLPAEECKIAIEQWAETYIRCWIRLGLFVTNKRHYSIGRDYAFFEWLASKSLEFQEKRFRNRPIHFYHYQKTGFEITETYTLLINDKTFGLSGENKKKGKAYIGFRRPDQVEKDIEGRTKEPLPMNFEEERPSSKPYSGLISLGPEEFSAQGNVIPDMEPPQNRT